MRRHFYATAEDLLAVFDRVEARSRLAYTLTGLFETSELTTAHSGATIPTLHSPAPRPGAIAGFNYLVTAADEPVVVREVPQRGGGTRYAVDQLANPRSVALMPGGVYPPNVRLYGRIGTASDAEFSLRLYRAFAGALGKLFRRVGAYHVGRQAEGLWLGGQRLTIGADSPPDGDLAVPGLGSRG
ncbi:MAG: hypothetical protein P4L84_28770 [Isosphaeraceae bacterium]|nr:hypothetical protein [Isosphaeraceae bacterium]